MGFEAFAPQPALCLTIDGMMCQVTSCATIAPNHLQYRCTLGRVFDLKRFCNRRHRVLLTLCHPYFTYAMWISTHDRFAFIIATRYSQFNRIQLHCHTLFSNANNRRAVEALLPMLYGGCLAFATQNVLSPTARPACGLPPCLLPQLKNSSAHVSTQ